MGEVSAAPSPKQKERKKPFTSKTTFPLAAWIDVRCEPRNSPFNALHYHHCYSSPKPHTCGALLVGPHDKLLLGLLLKISTRWREWLGRRERKRGAVGIPTKPGNRQTKERDKFLPLLTSEKRINFNHKWLPLRSRKGHQELGHVCICVCLLVQLTQRSCANLFVFGMKKVREGPRWQDKKTKKTTCFFALLRSEAMAECNYFFCHTDPTFFCVLLCSQQNKTLYTASRLLSFLPRSFGLCSLSASLLHPSPPSIACSLGPLLPPSLPYAHPFSLWKTASCPFLCLLCLWSLIRKINKKELFGWKDHVLRSKWTVNPKWEKPQCDKNIWIWGCYSKVTEIYVYRLIEYENDTKI